MKGNQIHPGVKIKSQQIPRCFWLTPEWEKASCLHEFFIHDQHISGPNHVSTYR